MNTWAKKLLHLYTTFNPPESLPDGTDWLYPQKRNEVQKVLNEFLHKYYLDNEIRTLILGINPGRYGAGITGINFTAPKQLKENCGIENQWKGSELSAEFIYAMIDAYGGTKPFYSKFFIGSVCPLGLVQNGKNLNYYDDNGLLKTLEPFIFENLSKLVSYNSEKSKCICIGGEKNFKYLSNLNQKYKWFKKIISVPHPRFIMQYKRKFVKDYIRLYLEVLKENN
jgi:hypothetical protein